MNSKSNLVLIVSLLLLGGAALVAVGQAGPAQGGAQTVVAYQGEVRVDSEPYTGDGYFKFAVVNELGTTTYWANDGTPAGEPAAAVQLDVSHGLFSVLLGDTNLTGMTQPLTAAVFDEPDRHLRVWFSISGADGSFDHLTPDTRIAAVPYALQAEEAANADTVDGLHSHELGAHYQNVVVVAKSGGDHSSVQAAIDSIAGAAADNAFLVWVAPGVYSETVTMKPYVHVQGAGQGATIISSDASSAWPPAQATLVLTRDVSLRDLSLENVGAGDYNLALLATAGTMRTIAADVTARAAGGGVSNYAVAVVGSPTGVTLQRTTALAENGSDTNVGLFNSTGAAAVLRGGSFTALGGTAAYGVSNSGSSTTLECEGVTALGEDGSDNAGLINSAGAEATLRGGSFTARGGSDAFGLSNEATLDAEGVTALGEDASLDNHALWNGGGTAMADSSQFIAIPALFVAEGTVYLGVSQVTSDPVVDSSGTLHCFQVYDAGYNAFDCQ